MKKYKLTWWDEVQYELEIEAESKEKAQEMFENGQVEYDKGTPLEDQYVEDSLEVEEMGELQERPASMDEVLSRELEEAKQ